MPADGRPRSFKLDWAEMENTPMFVQIAEGLGIRSILHTDYNSTCAKVASFGFQNEGHP